MHPDTEPAPRCPHCAALEARVAELEAHRDRLLEGIEDLLDIAEQYGYRRDWARTIFVRGDLTDAAPERTKGTRT